MLFVLQCEPFFQVARKHKRSTTSICNPLTKKTNNKTTKNLPGHGGVPSEGLAVVGAHYNEGGGLPVAPTVELLGTEAVL